MEPFFASFEKNDGEPLTCGQGIHDDKDVCYCVANEVDGHYMNSVTSGGSGLEGVICLVDEVDDLVVDQDPTSPYVHLDHVKSRFILPCFQALASGSRVKPPGCSESVWQLANTAKRQAEGKRQGTDYSRYEGKYCMLNDRQQVTNHVGHWLNYLNFRDFSRKAQVQSSYFVTCTPHVFNQYEILVGFTGSVGGTAERKYLKDTYKAEIIRVPKFLDTCTGTPPKEILRFDSSKRDKRTTKKFGRLHYRSSRMCLY